MRSNRRGLRVSSNVSTTATYKPGDGNVLRAVRVACLRDALSGTGPRRALGLEADRASQSTGVTDGLDVGLRERTKIGVIVKSRTQ